MDQPSHQGGRIGKEEWEAEMGSGGAELHDWLLLLIDDVWKRGKVDKDWQDVVPIPKKGDLRKCDNRRGISLLGVVGKVFARILQDRLQVVHDEEGLA